MLISRVQSSQVVRAIGASRVGGGEMENGGSCKLMSPHSRYKCVYQLHEPGGFVNSSVRSHWTVRVKLYCPTGTGTGAIPSISGRGAEAGVVSTCTGGGPTGEAPVRPRTALA